MACSDPKSHVKHHLSTYILQNGPRLTSTGDIPRPEPTSIRQVGESGTGAPARPETPRTVTPPQANPHTQVTRPPGTARPRTVRTTRPPIPPDPTIPVRRRRYRRPVRNAMRLALVLCLIIGTAVGVTAFRLSKGPIPLTFLKSSIEHSIAAEFGGNDFTIGDVALQNGDRGLELGLTDIRIRQSGVTTLLQIPSANIAIAPRALLSGRIALERIELLRPRVQLDYAADGRLAMTVAKPHDKPDGGNAPPASSSQSTSSGDAAAVSAASDVDFVKIITSMTAQARRRETASAYLRSVGLRDATVVLDTGRRKTIWHVPAIHVDLSHKRSQSRVSGRAEIKSLTGPIELEFQAIESAADQSVVLDITLTGANPRGLARQLPAIASFAALDLPLDGKTRIVFRTDGIITNAEIELTARSGQVFTHSSQIAPMSVKDGGLVAKYSRDRRQFEVFRAYVGGEYGAVEMRGTVTPVVSDPNAVADAWAFAFEGVSGRLGATEHGTTGLPLEALILRGVINADHGDIALETASIRVAGIDITAQSSQRTSGDPNPPVLEGRIGAAPLTRLLAAWPKSLHPDAHQWMTRHVTAGQLTGGNIRLRTSSRQQSEPSVELALEVQKMEIAAQGRLPRLSIPTALLQLNNGTLELTAPDVLIGEASRRVGVKTARFTTAFDPSAPQRTGHLSFRLQSALSPLAEMLDREPAHLIRGAGLNTAAIDGKIEGHIKLGFPLVSNIAMTELTTEGRLRITDGRIKGIFGAHDLSGAKIDIDISDKAVDVSGDVLFAGIPVRVAAQHILNQPPDRQPPIKLTATLDNADRTALGLDINDIIQGEVPVDIQITREAKGEARTRVVADLTRAELSLDSLAWYKQAGKPGAFAFEPQRHPGGRLDLNNVKLSGDTIAAEGSIVIGADNKPKEFSFREFTINTISRLEVYGTMKAGNIWDIRAKGIRFDARDVFREMFNVGATTKRPLSKNKPGLDLTAEIDTVLGYEDTHLRNVRILMQRRIDGGVEKMTSLDLIASHDNGKSFQAQIRNDPRNGRRLAANSEDAGLTFKTVGFYPNASGGRLGIEVQLDGKAGVERSGSLVATQFAVLGDPVVSEVFQNTDTPASGTTPRQRIVRQQFDFDWMRIPFLVGSGQFVMNDAQIRGPVLGATWRGKVDFHAKAMQINGTYVPLQGLNSAVSGIPILGQLLTGPKGEGMFGITFSVMGSTANPEVVVNPLSMMAPGVFREMFQLGPDQYRIIPRIDALPPARGDAARASSAPPQAPGRVVVPPQKRSSSQDLSGWSSETKTAPPRVPPAQSEAPRQQP